MEECMICQETCKYQKFLSCGSSNERHRLCQICIKKLTKARIGNLPFGTKDEILSVECPLCRQITYIPNGDSRKLETKFFAQLTCEDCSDKKIVGEQWWCKTCEMTVCSKCAMVRHRLHECSHWENYDVPKECLLYFKKRMKENDKNAMKQKIQLFCVQLEKNLVNKLESSVNYDLFIKSIEKCFGNLTLNDKTCGIGLNNVEKKYKSTLDLIKSTEICSNVEMEKLYLSFKDGDDPLTSLRFPSMDEILKLFEQPNPGVIASKKVFHETKDELVLATATSPKPALPSPAVELPGSSKPFDPSIWVESSKNRLSPSGMDFAALRSYILNVDRDWNGRHYDWNGKFNIAVGSHNNLCYAGNSGLELFRLEGDMYRTSSMVNLENVYGEFKAEMCLPQIVYNEVRKSFFVTVQANKENKIGYLCEFNERELSLVIKTKLPLTKIKTNTLHLLTVLQNGTVVILISDGIKMYIFLKFIKLMERDQCDRAYENGLQSYLAPNVPLENFTQLKSRFFAEGKEMLIVSGKKSIYCFAVIKNKIHFTNYFKDVLAVSPIACYSHYVFANDTSLFIADFGQSKLREIKPKLDSFVVVKETGLDNVDELAPVIALTSAKEVVYVIKPCMRSEYFCQHCIIVYKLC